jgi:hypothetical protein
VTAKFKQDPDPLRMDQHWFGSLDPDPHCSKTLDPDIRIRISGSALKTVRIRKTDLIVVLSYSISTSSSEFCGLLYGIVTGTLL